MRRRLAARRRERRAQRPRAAHAAVKMNAAGIRGAREAADNDKAVGSAFNGRACAPSKKESNDMIRVELLG